MAWLPVANKRFEASLLTPGLGLPNIEQAAARVCVICMGRDDTCTCAAQPAPPNPRHHPPACLRPPTRLAGSVRRALWPQISRQGTRFMASMWVAVHSSLDVMLENERRVGRGWIGVEGPNE